MGNRGEWGDRAGVAVYWDDLCEEGSEGRAGGRGEGSMLGNRHRMDERAPQGPFSFTCCMLPGHFSSSFLFFPFLPSRDPFQGRDDGDSNSRQALLRGPPSLTEIGLVTRRDYHFFPPVDSESMSS